MRDRTAYEILHYIDYAVMVQINYSNVNLAEIGDRAIAQMLAKGVQALISDRVFVPNLKLAKKRNEDNLSH